MLAPSVFCFGFGTRHLALVLPQRVPPFARHLLAHLLALFDLQGATAYGKAD